MIGGDIWDSVPPLAKRSESRWWALLLPTGLSYADASRELDLRCLVCNDMAERHVTQASSGVGH